MYEYKYNGETCACQYEKAVLNRIFGIYIFALICCGMIDLDRIEIAEVTHIWQF